MNMDAEDIVFYEDQTLIAVNKPSQVLTLPDGYDPHLPYLRSLLEPLFGPLYIVHRLDRDTSGVLLLARTPDAHRALNQQFQEHAVNKVYHALTHNNPPWESITIDYPLRPNGDRHHRTIVDHQHGKEAITEFRVLKRFERVCLLEARPLTGRRHQIRVHLASINLPILADQLYGQESSQGIIQRLALHAFSIRILHPTTNETTSFEAPYPPDFAHALRSAGSL
ncbi:MAG: RluA family pseudouridine synthase [Chloroflexota bacterium]